MARLMGTHGYPSGRLRPSQIVIPTPGADGPAAGVVHDGTHPVTVSADAAAAVAAFHAAIRALDDAETALKAAKAALQQLEHPTKEQQ